MKVIKRIIFILLILNICAYPFMITTNATSLDDMVDSAETFLSKGEDPYVKISKTKLQETSNTIWQWLIVIAISVAVIVGAVLGVQFIMGSVEGKAKIMEALLPYAAGCIVAFGSFWIWELVVNIGEENTSIQQIKTAGQDAYEIVEAINLGEFSNYASITEYLETVEPLKGFAVSELEQLVEDLDEYGEYNKIDVSDYIRVIEKEIERR